MRLHEVAKGYTGYLVAGDVREQLLKRFPPKYSRVLAHHVTHKFRVTADDTPDPAETQVVGYAQAEGIEALVVAVDGSTKRPDGGVYHITLSLDPETRSPKDSNDIIARGYRRVDPIDVRLEPKFFPF